MFLSCCESESVDLNFFLFSSELSEIGATIVGDAKGASGTVEASGASGANGARTAI